jgi:pimeloyl-ACP methyl ester carboxylesterase
MCAQIIDSVMRMKDPATGAPFRDRISSVRLVGFSYGGNLMLQALRDPRAKDWRVDRALVVSTPVDFLRTSQLFDFYDLADGTHFSKMSLAKLLKGYTPCSEVLTPREESLMRAGLGYSFHGDMALIFADNVRRYAPDLLEQLKAFSEEPGTVAHRKKELDLVKARSRAAMANVEQQKGRLSEAEYDEQKRSTEEMETALREFAGTRLSNVARWTFRAGRFLLVRPYWDAKADYSDFGRLTELLKGAPNFVQVVIAEDDPLNLVEDLQAFKATVKEPQLLMIPHGGHLGMSGTQWFQAMMAKYFAAK